MTVFALILMLTTAPVVFYLISQGLEHEWRERSKSKRHAALQQTADRTWSSLIARYGSANEGVGDAMRESILKPVGPIRLGIVGEYKTPEGSRYPRAVVLRRSDDLHDVVLALYCDSDSVVVGQEVLIGATLSEVKNTLEKLGVS